MSYCTSKLNFRERLTKMLSVLCYKDLRLQNICIGVKLAEEHTVEIKQISQ